MVRLGSESDGHRDLHLRVLPAPPNKCSALSEYMGSLDNQDAVVVEASAGAPYWAERIQAQGASSAVIDAHGFRVIRDSRQKTGKRDAASRFCIQSSLTLLIRLAEQKEKLEREI